MDQLFRDVGPKQDARGEKENFETWNLYSKWIGGVSQLPIDLISLVLCEWMGGGKKEGCRGFGRLVEKGGILSL